MISQVKGQRNFLLGVDTEDITKDEFQPRSASGNPDHRQPKEEQQETDYLMKPKSSVKLNRNTFQNQMLSNEISFKEFVESANESWKGTRLQSRRRNKTQTINITSFGIRDYQSQLDNSNSTAENRRMANHLNARPSTLNRSSAMTSEEDGCAMTFYNPAN